MQVGSTAASVYKAGTDLRSTVWGAGPKPSPQLSAGRLSQAPPQASRLVFPPASGSSLGIGASCPLPRRCLFGEGLSPKPPPLPPHPSLSFLQSSSHPSCSSCEAPHGGSASSSHPSSGLPSWPLGWLPGTPPQEVLRTTRADLGK